MILICGIPRSGTTWIAKILSAPQEIDYCHEPDNEHNNLLGYIHKQNMPRFPYLTPENSRNGIYKIYENVVRGNYQFGFNKSSLLIKNLLNIDITSIEKEIKIKNKSLSSACDPSFKISKTKQIQKSVANQLFRLTLFLKDRTATNRRILVKSVHSILSLSYLQYYFKPHIAIVLRHPANIISSHLKLDNPDMWRNIFNQVPLVQDYLMPFQSNLASLTHPLEKAGAQVSAIYFVLSKQLTSNPDWVVTKHENFCLNPFTKFRDLFKKLDIQWSEKIQAKINDLNKSGKGYTCKRVAENQVNKWKKRLNTSQVEHIKKGYSIFPHSFYNDFSLKNT